MQVRDTVKVFAEAMEQKLRRDDDVKSGWEKDIFVNLANMLDDEVEELHMAMMDFATNPGDESVANMMLECADVALCAMMIFSRLHPLTMHNVRGRAVPKVPKSCACP